MFESSRSIDQKRAPTVIAVGHCYWDKFWGRSYADCDKSGQI